MVYLKWHLICDVMRSNFASISWHPQFENQLLLTVIWWMGMQKTGDNIDDCINKVELNWRNWHIFITQCNLSRIFIEFLSVFIIECEVKCSYFIVGNSNNSCFLIQPPPPLLPPPPSPLSFIAVLPKRMTKIFMAKTFPSQMHCEW